MANTIGVITHPIALCAYVLFLMFGLAARSEKNRHLFSWVAVSMAFVSLAGGLLLAWRQVEKAMPIGPAVVKTAALTTPVSVPQLTPSPVTHNIKRATNGSVQTSHGAQSPNMSGVGGNVDIRYGSPAAGNSPESSEKQK